MNKFELEVFRSMRETKQIVALSDTFIFMFRRLRSIYRLYHDILDEEAYWIAFRRHHGGGMLPGEAFCKILLIRLRQKHEGLRKILFW